jgi:hypothetical protein
MRRMPRSGHGLAPPLTKEQIDEQYQAQALSRAEIAEVQERLAKLGAEKAALQAKLQQVKAESQVRETKLRGTENWMLARTAAKQGDGKAQEQK